MVCNMLLYSSDIDLGLVSEPSSFRSTTPLKVWGGNSSDPLENNYIKKQKQIIEKQITIFHSLHNKSNCKKFTFILDIDKDNMLSFAAYILVAYSKKAAYLCVCLQNITKFATFKN